MDVEHRGDRHIDIAAMEPVGRFDRAEPGQHAHGVKHKLAGIGNRLRIARGAGGVEGGRPLFSSKSGNTSSAGAAMISS